MLVSGGHHLQQPWSRTSSCLIAGAQPSALGTWGPCLGWGTWLPLSLYRFIQQGSWAWVPDTQGTHRTQTWLATLAGCCLQQHLHIGGLTSEISTDSPIPSSTGAGRDWRSLVRAHTHHSPSPQAHAQSKIPRVPAWPPCPFDTPARTPDPLLPTPWVPSFPAGVAQCLLQKDVLTHTSPLVAGTWSLQHSPTRDRGRDHADSQLRKDVIRRQDSLWWSGAELHQTSVLTGPILHATSPFYIPSCQSPLHSSLLPLPLQIPSPVCIAPSTPLHHPPPSGSQSPGLLAASW